MSSHPDAISASRLDAFLDQAEAALAQQQEAGIDPALIRASLKSMMDAGRYRADTLSNVRRLYSLWLGAGEPLAALRVIDTDGVQLAEALPEDERGRWPLNLAFFRMEPLHALGEHAAFCAGLEAAYALLSALPAGLQYEQAWGQLADQSVDAGAYELARRCALGRHALARANPARARLQAWDDTLLAISTAHSFTLEGREEEARQFGTRAIEVLASAGADQEIAHGDWLSLGHSLVEIVPEAIDAIVRQARARIPADLVMFARRDIDVRVARLEALALRRQGALAQALDKMALARTVITGDKDDRYSGLMLEWLFEAGRHADAARLAFDIVYHELESTGTHALGATRQALAEGLDGQPYWQLALACAGMTEAGAGVREGEDEAPYVGRQLALARALAPAHPAIDAVEGLYLLKAAGDSRRAVPLLEAAVRDASLAKLDLVVKLSLARIHLHGALAALAMPFVPAAGAHACYETGVHLESLFGEHLQGQVHNPKEAAAAFAARYYNLGLARFDAYLAGATGHSGDGFAPACAMLCNNLAVYYRDNLGDTAGALALHYKGIDASALPHHYDGILSCHRMDRNDAGVVDSAEMLWHSAAENGDTQHHPAMYVGAVCAALHRLGREADIPIWLERLEQWWRDAHAQTRAMLEKAYLGTLVEVLSSMMHTQPADALPRLDALLPAVRAAAVAGTSRIAAHALHTAGQPERAHALYMEALDQLAASEARHTASGTMAQFERFQANLSRTAHHIRPGLTWHASLRADIVDGIATCASAAATARPWWKRW
ncbi:hypothetical protein [Massilia genomosp. 1]|uniref:Uncharacterized protein n=1 Tax=Massilia genomosp. 1 TaxID=2609280 RepID=A0ABX0MMN6_9BURK|nr:hypothetical protein [Massilia genomosp. 1]NHZ61716.1 hypothetical protein [Massilia genomosp. 1]